MAKKPPPKKPRLVAKADTPPKNQRLKGLPKGLIAEIEDRADELEAARARRAEATEGLNAAVSDANDDLVRALHKHKKRHYERVLSDGFRLVIDLPVVKEKATVKRIRVKTDQEAEESEE